MNRSFVAGAVALLAVFGLTACSSGSSKGKASGTSTSVGSAGSGKTWDATAAAAAKQLAAKVRAADPSQCKNFDLLPYDQYVTTANTIKSPIPAAVGDCDAFGQSIEFSTFSDADARAAFVSKRSEILCRKAASAKYDLDGVRWTTDQNWSVQVDNQAAGDQVATILGGKYDPSACPNHDQIDWEDAAVTKIRTVAQTLAKNKELGCTGFELLDRGQYRRIQAYNGRLPAAYGRCSGPSNSVLWIAAFSPQTITRDKFIATETKAFCDAPSIGKNVAAVKGPDDTAIIATNVKAAALAARATGGTALDPAC